MAEIYLKIYVENDDTLVFEGQGNEDKEGYYPTRWDDTAKRIGTVVVGAEHIAITEKAKKAFERIVREARRTGDDISCIDIHPACRKINGKFEERPTDVCISYIGDVITKINIEEAIRGKDFFIGIGEGAPKPELLRKLKPLAPKYKTNKALDVVIEFWRNEIGDATDEQMDIFVRELKNNLGQPLPHFTSTLDGGSVGYNFDYCQIVPNAIESAGINFGSGDRISVQITPWYSNPQKRTIRVYRNSDNGTELATVEEE